MRPPLNRKGPPKIDPSGIKKILLVRLRRIGDIILTTPAITVLRKSYPGAFLSYVVEEPYRELVEESEYLDKVIVLPRNMSIREFLKNIRQIQREKYDAVIDFHGGPKASLITFLSQARIKIGYRIKYRNLIYDIKIPRGPREGYIHSAENHINLVKTLGAKIESFPPLYIPPAQKAEVRKVDGFLAKNNLEGFKTIVLHIGAGNEFRKWGINNFVQLIDLLSRDPKVKIVLAGSAGDKEAEEEIKGKSVILLLSSVSKFNLRELQQLISLSSLFVGPDSGPMHLAAATLTPIVALFGPNLSKINAPWQAKAEVIEKELECRPCDQRKCIYGDIRCLRSITPEEVFKACMRFL